MKRKNVLSCIMIFLCFVMVTLQEFPHHHHDGIICMAIHSGTNHSHNTRHDCKSCFSNSVYTYKKQDKEQQCSQHLSKEYTSITITQVDRLLKPGASLQWNSFHIEKLHDRHFYNSRGLRSPPYLS